MNHKKKVLFVSNYYHPYKSGLTFVVQRYAEFLAEHGLDVTVYCWSHDKQRLPGREIINNVNVKRFPGTLNISKGIISFSFMHAILFKTRGFDLVIPVLPMAEGFFFVNTIKTTPIVTLYICDIQLGNSLISKLIETVSYSAMKFLLKNSKRVLTISSNEYSESSRLLSLFPDKVDNGTCPVNWKERFPEEPSKFLNKYTSLQKSKRIGFMGRIVSEKGLDVFIKAIGEEKELFEDCDIIIAGEYANVAGGSVKSELDMLIYNYGIEVHFLDFIPEDLVNSFFSSLDVFVLPSKLRLEAFGIVQVEALLCGTPVVSTNLPGVRKIVDSTGYGKVAEKDNSVSLRESILEVINNKSKYIPDRDRVIKILDLNHSENKFLNVINKELSQ